MKLIKTDRAFIQDTDGVVFLNMLFFKFNSIIGLTFI